MYLLWSLFSRIRPEYGEILRISPHSVRMREDTDQNNSEYGHFSRSECYYSIDENINNLWINFLRSRFKPWTCFNPLSANPTKCSNALKQFVSNLPTNCLNVSDHFVGLVLTWLKKEWQLISLSKNRCFRGIYKVNVIRKTYNHCCKPSSSKRFFAGFFKSFRYSKITWKRKISTQNNRWTPQN